MGGLSGLRPGLAAAALYRRWDGRAWPLLLATAEQEDGAGAVARPLRLVCGAEGLHLLFVLLAGYGGFEAARFWANLFWTLLAAARGWAALALYRAREED